MKKVCNFCEHYDYEHKVCLALDIPTGYAESCKNPLFFEMNLKIVEELIRFAGNMDSLIEKYETLNNTLNPVMYMHNEQIKAYNAFVTIHNVCANNKLCTEKCLYYDTKIEGCIFSGELDKANLNNTKLANLI